MDYAEVREAFLQPAAVSAADVGTAAWRSPARRLRDAIEPIAMIYAWAEPAYDAYAARGLDFLSGYVWARASVLGEPDPGVVVAAFGVFEPGMLTSAYETARWSCTLAEIRAACWTAGPRRSSSTAGSRPTRTSAPQGEGG